MLSLQIAQRWRLSSPTRCSDVSRAVRDTRGQCTFRSERIIANRFGIALIEVVLGSSATASEHLALYLGTTEVHIAAMKAAFEGGHVVPPPPPYPGLEHLGSAYFSKRSWGVLSFGSCSDGSLMTVGFALNAEMPSGV